MNYTKPEITVLGEAIRVIENNLSQKQGSAFDPGQANPAYDLDE